MTFLSRTVVFLGPTLKRSDAELISDVTFKGPAAMGDIARAASMRAELIVLIDGNFESVPSVWHKEILWAISCGIPVIGASSMGALRAAELKDHGMMGYGEVYESFAEGHLTDDDEVAVLHGPPETGWLPLSDAMVDIRSLANNAIKAGVLTVRQAQDVASHAKAEFFKKRSFISSCQAILSQSDNPASSKHICDWYASQTRGIKEDDCRALLSNLSAAFELAQQNISKALAFTPTVYMGRLQKFGFQKMI
jgi:hypothetical protein